MSIFDGMSQEELDREYSPSSCAPGYADTLRRYREESVKALETLPCRAGLRYGPAPAEALHFFPAAGAAAPLLVFVHGGHWQESSKDDACFAAPDLVTAGAAYAALGYGLAPGHSLPAMVDSVRRGLLWLRGHAAELGVDPERIFVGGSSAGAHLTAAALSPIAGRAVSAAGAFLLSGVYDLEPVRLSYVNDAVGMDAVTASAYSPLCHLPLAAPSLIVARGGAETREYARQHDDLVTASRRAGHEPVDLVDPSRNHFDLPFDLGRPGTLLGDAVLSRMGLG
jgi:arylformamidase